LRTGDFGGDLSLMFDLDQVIGGGIGIVGAGSLRTNSKEIIR
jgi:hypothetical protein